MAKQRFKDHGNGLLLPEITTIEAITRHNKKQGTFAVGHDGRFAPPDRSFSGNDLTGAEIRGRRWTPTRVSGEAGGLQVMSVGEMENRLVPQFLADEVLIDLEIPVGEMITTSQGA